MSDINETLKNLRVNYQLESLDVKDCHKNPIYQFDKWFREATTAKCDEPNAFVLSTLSQSGWPRSRVLLLKGIHEERFIFYTNYKSSKGEEVIHHNKVSMNFLWLPLQRQVRIEGLISKVSEEMSDDYFKVRPRGSQIGAVASPQSQKVSSREALEQMFQEAEQRFENVENIPRPKNWGGYEVTPVSFEFWQGRSNRMHDRICYEISNGNWEIQRIAP